MPSSHEWTRVIVLTRPQAGLSAALREVFTARDWFPIEQDDPYLALAELCVRQRAQAARAAWGLQPLERLALVVVEPQQWPHMVDLSAAARRYVPGASVWTAEQDELTLHAAAELPLEAEALAPAILPLAEEQHSSLVVREHTPRPAVEGSTNGGSEASDESRHRISREEIDMLLELRHGEDDR